MEGEKGELSQGISVPILALKVKGHWQVCIGLSIHTLLHHTISEESGRDGKGCHCNDSASDVDGLGAAPAELERELGR
jgi:hypothetical protein